jgi:hypothetical protein
MEIPGEPLCLFRECLGIQPLAGPYRERGRDEVSMDRGIHTLIPPYLKLHPPENTSGSSIPDPKIIFFS